MLFAEGANSYWQTEKDIDGILQSYYFVKSDEQLDNLLPYMVRKHLGLRYEWQEPNYTRMKNSFLSNKYLLSSDRYIFAMTSYLLWENSWIYEPSKAKMKEYKYALWIYKSALIYIIKQIGDVRYLSLTVCYPSGSFEYTEDVLMRLNDVAKEDAKKH